MAIALSIFGVASSAVCVWLTVRTVNRRERWARWALEILITIAVLYPPSLGPAICFYRAAGQPEWMSNAYAVVYGPLDFTFGRLPLWAKRIASGYVDWWKAS